MHEVRGGAGSNCWARSPRTWCPRRGAPPSWRDQRDQRDQRGLKADAPRVVAGERVRRSRHENLLLCRARGVLERPRLGPTATSSFSFSGSCLVDRLVWAVRSWFLPARPQMHFMRAGSPGCGSVGAGAAHPGPRTLVPVRDGRPAESRRVGRAPSLARVGCAAEGSVRLPGRSPASRFSISDSTLLDTFGNYVRVSVVKEICHGSSRHWSVVGVLFSS